LQYKESRIRREVRNDLQDAKELLDLSPMHLARVVGTVVATVKTEALEGRKLLVIQPIDTARQDTGKTLVAIDAIGAGVGETVFWCRGKEASFPFDPKQVPTDCTIVGIVDTIFTETSP
jgi:ethanolamine utilization protein EutN